MTLSTQQPTTDSEVAFLTSLAESGFPPDYAEPMVRGDASRGVSPAALTKALRAVRAHERRLFEAASYTIDAAGGLVEIQRKFLSHAEDRNPYKPLTPDRAQMLTLTPERARLMAERLLRAADLADGK